MYDCRYFFFKLCSMQIILCFNRIGDGQYMFPKFSRPKIVPGPQQLDLHGYSVGASQWAVRWWLEMTVAPYLASASRWVGEGEISKKLPITLVTGWW